MVTPASLRVAASRPPVLRTRLWAAGITRPSEEALPAELRKAAHARSQPHSLMSSVFH